MLCERLAKRVATAGCAGAFQLWTIEARPAASARHDISGFDAGLELMCKSASSAYVYILLACEWIHPSITFDH